MSISINLFDFITDEIVVKELQPRMCKVMALVAQEPITEARHKQIRGLLKTEVMEWIDRISEVDLKIDKNNRYAIRMVPSGSGKVTFVDNIEESNDQNEVEN